MCLYWRQTLVRGDSTAHAAIQADLKDTQLQLQQERARTSGAVKTSSHHNPSQQAKQQGSQPACPAKSGNAAAVRSAPVAVAGGANDGDVHVAHGRDARSAPSGDKAATAALAEAAVVAAAVEQASDPSHVEPDPCDTDEPLVSDEVPASATTLHALSAAAAAAAVVAAGSTVAAVAAAATVSEQGLAGELFGGISSMATPAVPPMVAPSEDQGKAIGVAELAKGAETHAAEAAVRCATGSHGLSCRCLIPTLMLDHATVA